MSALGEPARFVLVGAGGYLVNLLVFSLLYALATPYVAAALVSYFVSNALMYLGNRYFTFRLGHEGFVATYLRYSAVGVVVVALNAALLASLVEGTGVHPTPAQALSLLLVTPVAFLLNKRWTFRVRPAEPRAEDTRQSPARAASTRAAPRTGGRGSSPGSR
ncbi:MAG: GtrA family protein [Thermoleophilia bacterium]|nr:GtrA family protein [Thermoleophilia bacterium]